MIQHPRYMRPLTLAVLAVTILRFDAVAQNAPSTEPAALRTRMQILARAREFGDIGVLRDLNSSWYMKVVQDTAISRLAQFRARSPSTPIDENDQTFRRFVSGFAPSANTRSFETLARAYRLIEQGDTEHEAALVILAYVYQFPAAPIVIANSSFSFARSDSSGAVYYLSEDWVIPLSNDTVPKRFVVQWFRSADGSWLLNEVR